MFLSVIIPTYNRNDLLSQCLVKLAPAIQKLETSQYEIIVSDDSKEGAAKAIIEEKFPFARWVAGPGVGPAANRNNGAKNALGNWFIFIDDDCIPDEEILGKYLLAIKSHNNIEVFEGAIKPQGAQRSLIEEAPLNETGGYLWSCNFMISKRLFFEALNGFDENFPYAAMEDVDLHYRLKKLLIKVYFLKEAIVIHPWRLQKKLLSITVKRFKSTLYFLRKHPERRKDINSVYFLRVFFNSLTKDTLRKVFLFRFRGFLTKLSYDALQLYFAAYLFIVRH
jgi:GT2 family glycosyltransferase